MSKLTRFVVRPNLVYPMTLSFNGLSVAYCTVEEQPFACYR